MTDKISIARKLKLNVYQFFRVDTDTSQYPILLVPRPYVRTQVSL